MNTPSQRMEMFTGNANYCETQILQILINTIDSNDIKPFMYLYKYYNACVIF